MYRYHSLATKCKFCFWIVFVRMEEIKDPVSRLCTHFHFHLNILRRILEESIAKNSSDQILYILTVL